VCSIMYADIANIILECALFIFQERFVCFIFILVLDVVYAKEQRAVDRT